MRTNIVIDDKLMRDALRASGLKTKREAIVGYSQSSSEHQKHDVAFEDAATVFLDPLAMTFQDPDDSVDEHREISIGHTIRGRLIFVPIASGKRKIRIVSACLATATERKQYEEEISRS